MAKAKNLAILAGLAGLAYANRDKLFGGKGKDKGKSESSGMTTEQNDELATVNRISKMSDDSDTLARVNREESSGVPKTKSDVLKAITAPKTAPNDQAGNQGVIASSKPSSTSKPKPKRTGMTGAQNTALANANKGMSQASITAAKDEDARLGNIKAARDYNRGRDMEREILNNMITNPPMKKGGMVKMASGGMTASRRADGIATKGKTRGKMC
jgi:hypothetical protein